ncbi:hypothetical protein POUND7_015755 [Theobroma cacao]
MKHLFMVQQTADVILLLEKEDALLNQTKKQIDHVLSEKKTLLLNCRSIEDKMELPDKHLEACEKLKGEHQKHYEDAIDDMTKLSDPKRTESLEWKRKHEGLLTKRNADNDNVNAEIAVVRTTCLVVLGAVNRTRAAESRIESCDNKSSDLNLKIRLLSEMHELLKREAHVLVQMRSKLLQQNLSGTKRFQEVYKRCEVAKQNPSFTARAEANMVGKASSMDTQM